MKYGLQFIGAGEVSSVFTPADNPENTFVGLAYLGGTASIRFPSQLVHGLQEGQVIQCQGDIKYQDKRGKVSVQFLGTALKPAGKEAA